MAIYIAGCWMFGLVWVGVLSALVESEIDWLPRIGRAVYVAGVAFILVVTAVIVGASTSFALFSPSRTGLWIYALGAALPVTLIGFGAARPALPRRWLVAAGTLPAVAIVLVAPAAYRPWGTRLDGLAAFAHDHHALVVAALALAIVVLGTTVALPRRAVS